MKDKEKELLLSKITKLKGYLSTYPHLTKEFPNLDGMVTQLHKAVAYQEVVEKDHAVIEFHKAELDDLGNFCDHIDSFTNDMRSMTVAASLSNKYLNLEILKNGENDIAAGLASIKTGADPAFHAAMDRMIAFVKGLSSGITMGSLLSALRELVLNEYEMINTKALKKTTSLKAVEEMKLPILEHHFFANYKKLYKGRPALKVPSSASICKVLEVKFGSAYTMTPADFSTEIGAWVDKIKGDVSKLVAHQYANCEVAVDLIAKDAFTQMGTLVKDHRLFSALQGGLNAAILSVMGTPTLLSDFAKNLPAALDQIKAMSVTIDLLQEVNQSGFFFSRLEKVVTIADLAIKNINVNSPYYITGQPNFRADLRQKLNAWKEALVNALGIASQTVLQLDGATFSAAAFKANMMTNVSNLVADIKNAFNGLALQDISLRGHQDLNSFNTQWDAPWRALVAAINPDALIQANEQNVKLLSALYTNLGDLLPSQDDVISALMGAVSGKVNLALEQAIANQKEMRSSFNQVNKKIDHIEQKVDRIENKVDILDQKVNKLQLDVTDIKNDQKKILKKLDELDMGDTNIEVNLDVNIGDLINEVEINLDINFVEKAKEIVNKFLEQGDIEKTFFEVSEEITLARWLMFSAAAVFGASLKGTLKSRLTDQGLGIESTAALTADAHAGLKFAAFSLCGYDGIAVIGTLHADLTAEAIARLSVNSETLIEGAMQANMILSGYAKFEFEVLECNLYEAESSRLNILVIKSPIYSIGFKVNTWEYKGAQRKSGDFIVDMHPDLKALLQKAKDVLSNPMTYLKAGVSGAIYLAETTVELIYDAGEAIYDGVGTVVDWINPFD